MSADPERLTDDSPSIISPPTPQEVSATTDEDGEAAEQEVEQEAFTPNSMLEVEGEGAAEVEQLEGLEELELEEILGEATTGISGSVEFATRPG